MKSPFLFSFLVVILPLLSVYSQDEAVGVEDQQVESAPPSDESTDNVPGTLDATIVGATTAPPGVTTVPTRLQPSVRRSFQPPLIIDDEMPTIRTSHITSTASRVDRTNQESPYIIDTISDTTLIERSVRSVPEAFEQTPGILVQKTAHGQGSPFIRGFTAYHNLFLIDGIRLNNSVFRSGPNQYWNTVDSQSLRQIELVKSQGSVLYGSDAVGGTVQALTKRPVYAEQGTLTGGRSYSRYAYGENSFIQRNEFTVSEAGEYGFILGGTGKDFGDIKSADLGTLPFTGYDEWDIDAKLELFLNEEALLTFYHQQSHINDAWRVHKTQFAVPFEGTTVGDERARIIDQTRFLTYAQLEGTANSPLFDHYQVSLSHQQQKEERFRQRADGRVDIQGFTVDTVGTWIQFDKYLGFADLSYGVSYYHDKIDSFRNDFNADGSFKRSNIQGPVGDNGSYDLIGAFIHSTTPIGEKLALDLGGRFTYAEAQIGKVEDPGTGNQISIDDNWENFSGSARLSYQLDEDDRFRLFSGVSQAFRAPNLADLSRLDSNRSNEIETPAPNLDPEQFLTYEIGLKAEAGRLSGSVTYFHTQVDDLILRTPTGRIVDGLNEVTKLNSGDGHVQGVEISGHFKIDEHWSVFGGFAYQDSKVSTFPTSAPFLQDEPLSRLLPLNGYTGLRWKNSEETLWIEGLVTAFDDADRLSTSDRRDTQRIPPDGTPGYWLATVRSGLELNEKLTVTSGIENLFNQAYRSHGSGQNEPGLNAFIGVELVY